MLVILASFLLTICAHGNCSNVGFRVPSHMAQFLDDTGPIIDGSISTPVVDLAGELISDLTLKLDKTRRGLAIMASALPGQGSRSVPAINKSGARPKTTQTGKTSRTQSSSTGRLGRAEETAHIDQLIANARENARRDKPQGNSDPQIATGEQKRSVGQRDSTVPVQGRPVPRSYDYDRYQYNVNERDYRGESTPYSLPSDLNRDQREVHHVAPTPIVRFSGIGLSKYSKGENWSSFWEEFHDEMMLAGINPVVQFIYLKRAIPEDGRKYLQHMGIGNLAEAVQALGRLYEPPKDVIEKQYEYMDLEQAEGEDLPQFLGRLFDAVSKDETRSHECQMEVVMGQFKRKIRNKYVRDNLVDFKCAGGNISELLEKAQRYDAYSKEEVKMDQQKPKSVRLVENPVDVQSLKAEITLLKEDQVRRENEKVQLEATLNKQLKELKEELDKVSIRPTSTGYSRECWTCGKTGHLSRDCFLNKNSRNQPRNRYGNRNNRGTGRRNGNRGGQHNSTPRTQDRGVEAKDRQDSLN